jgi:hypothetical protein
VAAAREHTKRAPSLPGPQAYPIASHWVWSGNGFLNAARADALFGTGAIDFSGAGAVHALGGVSALWAVKLIRERIGRFDAEGYVRTRLPGFLARACPPLLPACLPYPSAAVRQPVQ